MEGLILAKYKNLRWTKLYIQNIYYWWCDSFPYIHFYRPTISYYQDIRETQLVHVWNEPTTLFEKTYVCFFILCYQTRLAKFKNEQNTGSFVKYILIECEESLITSTMTFCCLQGQYFYCLSIFLTFSLLLVHYRNVLRLTDISCLNS